MVTHPLTSTEPHPNPAIEKEGALGNALLTLIVGKIGLDLYTSVSRHLKLVAIKYFPNQWLMNWIAGHDRDPLLRKAAAAKITKPGNLKRLLAREKNPKVRATILSRMSPSTLIVEYRVAKLPKTKMEVLDFLDAQDALVKILATERNPRLAMMILPRISDIHALAKLERHSLKEVRDEIKRRIVKIAQRNRKIAQNPKILLDAIMGVPKLNTHLKRMLVWVNTPTLWQAIAMQHPDHAVVQYALKALYLEQDVLGRMASDKDNPDRLRMDAAMLITKKSVLRDLAFTDNTAVRIQAISMLSPVSDADVIDKILRKERDGSVLSAAVMVSDNVDLLSKLSGLLTTDPRYKGLTFIVNDRIKRVKVKKGMVNVNAIP